MKKALCVGQQILPGQNAGQLNKIVRSIYIQANARQFRHHGLNATLTGEAHALAFTTEGSRLVVAVRPREAEVDCLQSFRLDSELGRPRRIKVSVDHSQPVTIRGLGFAAGERMAIFGDATDGASIAGVWPANALPVSLRPVRPGADLVRAP